MNLRRLLVMTETVMIARRLVLFLLVVGSTSGGLSLMSIILGANGWNILNLLVMLLFGASFGWLMLSFWTAAFGLYAWLRGGDRLSPDRRLDPTRGLTRRTAIIMPIYNEDTERVAAGIVATLTGFADIPERTHFDFFVLSDTTRAEIARREAAVFGAMAAEPCGGVRIFYRRRARNIGRKAGNIEDFVTRWGAAYDHMLVVDADSVMAPASILRLARMMEQNPDAGIIQTIPVPVNRETPFARILQFAARLYGPVMSIGLAYWSGGEANYYGHNGIIRIAAFARHCGLPILPGRAPLGGEILSHDFVEAALIRGGGYKVWLVPDVGGSYEEMPANIIDYAKRDRRWCQGNMQHARLIGLSGIKALSRFHLTTGVAAYLTSPVWFLLLMLASTDIVDSALVGPIYFKSSFSLFPNWPVIKSTEINLLLFLTLIALFLPRVMAIGFVLFNAKERALYGGAARLLLSCLIEVLFSVLLAPVMMLFQSLFVVSTFSGYNVSWDAQARDDRGLSWSEAFRRHAGHTAIGLVWGAIVYAVTPLFFWWLTPVLTGLVLSIPVSCLSSRSTLGVRLRKWGLFLTPDETATPPELIQLREILESEPAAAGDLPALGDEPVIIAPPEKGLIMPHRDWPLRPDGDKKTLQAANSRAAR